MRRAAVVGIGAAASAFGVAVWAAKLALAAPGLPIAQPVVSTDAYTRSADTVRYRQTLSALLLRHGVTGQALTDVLSASKEAISPKRLRPGLVLSFRHRWDSDVPDRIDSRLDQGRFLHLTRDDAGIWTTEIETIPWNVE